MNKEIFTPPLVCVAVDVVDDAAVCVVDRSAMALGKGIGRKMPSSMLV